MKRRFIIILTLIIAFALFACALSACAETPSSPPSDPPKNGTGDDRPTDPDDGHGGGSDGDTDGDTDGDGSGQTDAFSQRALLARLADAFVGGGNMALTADGELRTGDFVIVAEGLTCALDASEGVMMRGDAVRIALTRGEDAFTHSGEFFVGLGEESVAYFEDEETGALRADEDVDAYVIGRYGEELADAATFVTRLATGDLSALLGMGGGLTATGGEAVELIYALADFGGYETGEAGTVERTESGATLTFSYDADGLTDLLSSAHSALTEPPASLTDADVLGVFDNVGELFAGNMTLSDVLAITADTFVGSGVAPRKMLDAMMCAFGLPAPGDGELGMTLNGYIGRATDYADNYASVLASARESLRELLYTPLAERGESARAPLGGRDRRGSGVRVRGRHARGSGAGRAADGLRRFARDDARVGRGVRPAIGRAERERLDSGRGRHANLRSRFLRGSDARGKRVVRRVLRARGRHELGAGARGDIRPRRARHRVGRYRDGGRGGVSRAGGVARAADESRRGRFRVRSGRPAGDRAAAGRYVQGQARRVRQLRHAARTYVFGRVTETENFSSHACNTRAGVI